MHACLIRQPSMPRACQPQQTHLLAQQNHVTCTERCATRWCLLRDLQALHTAPTARRACCMGLEPPLAGRSSSTLRLQVGRLHTNSARSCNMHELAATHAHGICSALSVHDNDDASSMEGGRGLRHAFCCMQWTCIISMTQQRNAPCIMIMIMHMAVNSMVHRHALQLSKLLCWQAEARASCRPAGVLTVRGACLEKRIELGAIRRV